MPTPTQIANDAYALLGPAAEKDSQQGYALQAYVGAIGEMFRQVEELVRAIAPRDAWAQALDPTNCPSWLLPWLGQMVGVKVTPGVSTAAQRAQVKAEAGFQRGRITAMQSAVAATLTGAQSVTVQERTPDAWSLIVSTDPAQTPSSTNTQLAIQAAKAAGLIATYTSTGLPEVDQGTRTIDAAAVGATIDTATLANIS